MIRSRSQWFVASGRLTSIACVLALVAVAIGFVSCSSQSAPTPSPQATSKPEPASTPTADRPPAALVQIGQTATSLFDAAYASDWKTAAEMVRALNESASALPATLPKPDLAGQFQSQLTYVKEHVSGQQRVQTMDDANTITRLVADLSAAFQTPVPYEAVMLGYYGRQLELGIAAQKPSTLTQAAADLQSTWNRLEPAVERRGRVDDAKRFTDIVVQLVAARRPADFVSPTRAALTEAERIEKLFRSPT